MWRKGGQQVGQSKKLNLPIVAEADLERLLKGKLVFKDVAKVKTAKAKIAKTKVAKGFKGCAIRSHKDAHRKECIAND